LLLLYHKVFASYRENGLVIVINLLAAWFIEKNLAL